MFETPPSAFVLNRTRIVVMIGIGLFVVCWLFRWPFEDAWIYVLAGIVIIGQFARDEVRTKQIKGLATEMGLAFFGDTLPRHFPIQCASPRLEHSIRRVLAGDDVLLFDCRTGHGKGTRDRTVVAARGEPSVFGWAKFGPDLEIEHVAGWTLIYSSDRLMELEEIRVLISEVTSRKPLRVRNPDPPLNPKAQSFYRPDR